jgi:hypothetical protein
MSIPPSVTVDKPGGGAGSTPSGSNVSLICLALIVIVGAIFGQTLHDGFFSYDDDLNITGVPMVCSGLTYDGIKWAFAHSQVHRWAPLATVSRQVDCQLYGLRPWGHHFTNICLHALASVFLFLALRSLTGTHGRSALVAGIFAIHPLHVEPVVWISCRGELLGGAFFMLTLWAYARYARITTPSRYGMVVVWFLLGLLSKSMIVTLPLMLLLLDCWPLRRLRQWKDLTMLVLEKTPLMVIALLFSLIAIMLQSTTHRQWIPQSLGIRLGNAVVSLFLYLEATVWPHDLYLGYVVPEGGWSLGMIMLSISVLVLLSLMVFLMHRSKPYLLVGWLWFLVMLLPVLGIIPITLASRADRYMYLPQIGLVIAVVWMSEEWIRRFLPRSAFPVAVGLLSLSVIGVLGVTSWRQNSYWRDNITFWRHAMDSENVDKTLFKRDLGLALYESGDHSRGLALLEEAVRLNPNRVDERNSLGCILLDLGRYDEAINQFTEALKIFPGEPKSESNLGWALRKEGKFGEALIHMKKAL